MNVSQFRKANGLYVQRGSDLANSAADIRVTNTKVMVNNSGEAEFDIKFGVRYSQLPSMNFGFSLQTTMIPGRAPLISAKVVDWITEERPPFSRLYVGATILVVSEGPPGMAFIANCTATGIAFAGPTS